MPKLIRFIKRRFLIILFIFLLLLVYFFFTSNGLGYDQQGFKKLFTDLNPNLIASAFVAIITTYFLEGIIQAEKQEDRQALLTDIQEITGSLRRDEVSAVFNKARLYIEDCQEIMVIGTAKQKANGFESEAVEKYLHETLQRVKGRKALRYRRITALDLNDKFKSHLEECFREKGNNMVQLILLENFAPAYTYLIVDDKFLMVSLTYNNNTFNHRFCLYTEYNGGPDNHVIQEFRNHFDAIWQAEADHGNPVVNDIDEFEHIYQFQSRAAKHIKRIKQNINTFPYRANLFQEHALLQLDRLNQNFERFGRNTQRIVHETDNENLISIFIDYLKLMKSGCSYKTITFSSFWESMTATEELLKRFIDANRDALKVHAAISRLLVVDSNRLSDTDYTKVITTVIEQNVAILNEYPAYDFRVLFSARHEYYESNQYNFALITRPGGENVIFTPIRKNNNHIKETEITLYLDDNLVLQKALSRINDLNEKWTLQANTTIGISEKDYLQTVGISQTNLDRITKTLIIGN